MLSSRLSVLTCFDELSELHRTEPCIKQNNFHSVTRDAILRRRERTIRPEITSDTRNIVGHSKHVTSRRVNSVLRVLITCGVCLFACLYVPTSTAPLSVRFGLLCCVRNLSRIITTIKLVFILAYSVDT